jgi:hypothetical protein
MTSWQITLILHMINEWQLLFDVLQNIRQNIFITYEGLKVSSSSGFQGRAVTLVA